MKLVLRRNQRQGVLNKIVFELEVRADLSPTERANIKKYKLGDTELYASHDIKGGSGLLGITSRLAYKAMSITILVKDLENGKKFDCKDIVEMLAVQEQITEAAKVFKVILDAATHFGGAEVVEL